jgi:hypothetical protein
VDLVNAQPVLQSSCLGDRPEGARDKVRAVYPKIDWQHQLEYGQALGLGSRAYDLVKL